MENYDVILVNPDFLSIYNAKFPPFAAMFLSYALKKAGYSIRIFDTQFEKEDNLYECIKNNKPLWVGFSVMTGPTIARTLKICQKIREISSDIKIVWGGPHPTLLPKDTLKHKLIDIVVISEGEKTVVELTKTLKNNENLDLVNGIGYKKNEEIIITKPREFTTDWDNEVGLDWDNVKINNYIDSQGKYKKISLITSRGCPFRCKFCWNIMANNRRWRGWSAEKVIEEIQRLLPYGVNYITLEDDNFGVDLNRAKKILKFMKTRDILWSFEGVRVGKHITIELIQFFKENNCHHLSFGAECGNQKMLDYIAKDITVEQLIESARLTGQYKLGVRYSWIIGFPKETHADRMDLISLINKITELNPNCAHYIGIYGPHPGSEIFQETIEAGWIPPKNVEGWSLFREEVDLPYCKNMWYLRSIALACFFKFAVDSSLRAHSKTKIIYRIPFKILKFVSNIRWKYRLFHFPIEYKILTLIKNKIT
ncbi:B12-binding domain-containing radical SAM protein [Candidatus Woesearchaeota archaeon]|nr:B12-binding domain-containing radical SAM protein [Candidatus Woesearchaeota archaeon]